MPELGHKVMQDESVHTLNAAAVILAAAAHSITGLGRHDHHQQQHLQLHDHENAAATDLVGVREHLAGTLLAFSPGRQRVATLSELPELSSNVAGAEKRRCRSCRSRRS